MADSPTMDSSRARQDGYFDNVYSIFEAYKHSVIVVEDGAMRWMGLRLLPRRGKKNELFLFDP